MYGIEISWARWHPTKRKRLRWQTEEEQLQPNNCTYIAWSSIKWFSKTWMVCACFIWTRWPKMGVRRYTTEVEQKQKYPTISLRQASRTHHARTSAYVLTRRCIFPRISSFCVQTRTAWITARLRIGERNNGVTLALRSMVKFSWLMGFPRFRDVYKRLRVRRC
jgi:hypothetical protein